MGYSTEFYGEIEIAPPMKPEHIAYLQLFNRTRRVARKVSITKDMPDPVREAAGLPLGTDGEYFVGAPGSFGQGDTPDIKDHNNGGGDQPGVWCQWTVTDDGTALEWDGGEKFYEYDAWLRYILNHFITPWGYVANGEIEWKGEESEDLGKLVVEDNALTVRRGFIVYEGEGVPANLT